MSLPPPPGLKQPASLPPRPPPSASSQHSSSSFKPSYSSAPSYSSPGTTFGPTATHGSGPAISRPPSTGYSAFTAFAPRAVASSNQSYRTSSPAISTPSQPSTGYQTPAAAYPPAYQNPQQGYPGSASRYGDSNYAATASSVPHIANPFPLPGQERKGYGRDNGLDPETEAQIAQWQSAYLGKEADPAAQAKAPGRPGVAATGPNSGTQSYTASASATPTPVPNKENDAKTVVRSGGGQTWTDNTLLEWDPAHFRLFVGNLAGEVTDDSLKKAFSKYPSIQKARVIRDKRTEKSKGYGFVSFSDGDDYFKAAREMQGKYIGSHPVLLRRAMTEVRPTTVDPKNKKGNKGNNNKKAGSNPAAGGGKPKGDGVKKQGYTKGGLKILG